MNWKNSCLNNKIVDVNVVFVLSFSLRVCHRNHETYIVAKDLIAVIKVMNLDPQPFIKIKSQYIATIYTYQS